MINNCSWLSAYCIRLLQSFYKRSLLCLVSVHPKSLKLQPWTQSNMKPILNVWHTTCCSRFHDLPTSVGGASNAGPAQNKEPRYQSFDFSFCQHHLVRVMEFFFGLFKYIITTDKGNSLVYVLHSENPVCYIQSPSCLNINLKGQMIVS